MITGSIKTKVDKIWTDIWAGGITNPLTVVEQLTYLMFIRSLDEKELANESMEAVGVKGVPKIFPQTPTGQSMRWSKFRNKSPEEIFKVVSKRVFPAIKKMKGGRLPDFDASGELIELDGDEKQTAFTRYMENATFMIPTPQVLDKIITGLEELLGGASSDPQESLFDYENSEGAGYAEADYRGDLYEYMLGKLQAAGQNGQFRTPRHIIRMMVQLMAPTPDDVICDPACGTAGFLVESADYIRKHYEDDMTDKQWDAFASDTFNGFDTDYTMLRLSAMNLMLHSITEPHIAYQDSVSKNNHEAAKYTLCLANPPFKGTLDKETIHDKLKAVASTTKTELLFVALFLRILKKGGRCACIVPDGVLFGSSKAHKAIRKELVENHWLRAVISMPSGVFKPYAGVSTAILVFTKTGDGGTENVWFYDMKADGYTLDDKRSEIDDNDIPDIIERFNNLKGEAKRKRTDQSFFVPKQEIVDNEYDLSINKYKEIEYTPVEYPPTQQIMAELREIQAKIAVEMDELEKLLGDE